MAKSFSKIKDPKLGLLDKITFGKLKDCRVCDVIEDHHEYLIWCEKQGFVKFQPIVVETIQETANFKRWEPPEEEEEEAGQDKIKDVYEKITRQDYDWEDDVPF